VLHTGINVKLQQKMVVCIKTMKKEPPIDRSKFVALTHWQVLLMKLGRYNIIHGINAQKNINLKSQVMC